MAPGTNWIPGTKGNITFTGEDTKQNVLPFVDCAEALTHVRCSTLPRTTFKEGGDGDSILDLDFDTEMVAGLSK